MTLNTPYSRKRYMML